jgi:hypothetical protein
LFSGTLTLGISLKIATYNTPEYARSVILTNFPVRINRLPALQKALELTLPQIKPERQDDKRALDGRNK